MLKGNTILDHHEIRKNHSYTTGTSEKFSYLTDNESSLSLKSVNSAITFEPLDDGEDILLSVSKYYSKHGRGTASLTTIPVMNRENEKYTYRRSCKLQREDKRMGKEIGKEHASQPNKNVETDEGRIRQDLHESSFFIESGNSETIQQTRNGKDTTEMENQNVNHLFDYNYHEKVKREKSWENWYKMKLEQDKNKKRQIKQEEEERKLRKQQLEEEKRKKNETMNELREHWLQKKKSDFELEMRRKKEMDQIEHTREEQEKAMLYLEKQRSLEAWCKRKDEEYKLVKMKKQQSEKEKEDKQKLREERNKGVFENWLRVSKRKPRPLPLMVLSNKPSVHNILKDSKYWNPVPWKPLLES